MNLKKIFKDEIHKQNKTFFPTKRTRILLTLILPAVAIIYSGILLSIEKMEHNKLFYNYPYPYEHTILINTVYGYYPVKLHGSLHDMDDDLSKELKRGMDRIPKKLLNDFYKDSVDGLICSTDIFFTNGDPLAAGVTYIHEDTNVCYGIQLLSGSDMIKYIGEKPLSLCHEFGHYFDGTINDYISESEEFKKIFDEEHLNIFRYKDHYGTPKEYFAQSFAWYCFPNSSIDFSLKKDCPKTYDFIDKYVKAYLNE